MNNVECDYNVNKQLDPNTNLKIVLGVSFEWGKRKGQDVFLKLRELLNDNYIIVLVGTNEQIDRELPQGIISIHRTADQYKLAEIYTAADVFVNPTRDEVLGMVNLEALACGTPVVTFDGSGSQECVDVFSGCIVKKGDAEGMAGQIQNICVNGLCAEQSCIERAVHFSNERSYRGYLSLYKKIIIGEV